MADDGVSAGKPVGTDHLLLADQLNDTPTSPTRKDNDNQYDSTTIPYATVSPTDILNAQSDPKGSRNESAPVYQKIIKVSKELHGITRW